MSTLKRPKIEMYTWYDFPQVAPDSTAGLYVAQCNNGFITVCEWALSNSKWYNFYSVASAHQVGGVVKWMMIEDPKEWY